MKHALLAAILTASATSATAGVVYTSLEDLEAAAGEATSWIDLGDGDLPFCADPVRYKAYGEISGTAPCVASYTTVEGQRVYTMRGEAWHPLLNLRSGHSDGMTSGGGGYGAHLWNGPGTFLRPDPLGGQHLALEFRRPYIDSLGVHPTAGFYGWMSTGSYTGLLVLPHSAQITRLEFGHVRNAVSAPGTLALATPLLAVCLLFGRANPTSASRCHRSSS